MIPPTPWEGYEAERRFTTREEFLAGRRRRFGATNPDRMQIPFWEKMVRTGADPYRVSDEHGHESGPGDSTWCFSRIGATHMVYRDQFLISI